MLDKIKGGLIVSCQALEDEPLHGGDTMAKMAKAAEIGGAIGIRSNGPDDIKNIKDSVKLPIIGLNKIDHEGYEVYISPSIEDIKPIIEAGADMIAIDATKQSRPCEIEDLVEYIHSKNKLVLADISTYEEAINAQRLNCDAVAITMVSYTSYTKDVKLPAFELLEQLVKDLDIPVIAEGNFNTPEAARKAMDLGAHAVVVGSAITRPQIITKKFYEAIHND